MFIVRSASGVTTMRQRPLGAPSDAGGAVELARRRRGCRGRRPRRAVVGDPADERGASAERRRRPTRVLAAEPPDISIAGPMAAYSDSARSVSMSVIAPVIRPCSATNSSDLVAEHVDQRVADADDVEPVGRFTHRACCSAHETGRRVRMVTGTDVDAAASGRTSTASGGGRSRRALGLGAAVERGALLERAAERFDDGGEAPIVELLAVARPAAREMFSSISVPAEVVATRLERLARRR